MDESFEFLLSTQGFELSDFAVPVLPVSVDLTESPPHTSSSLAPPPPPVAAISVSSDDDDVAPTDDSPLNQTLTFIDFLADM